MNITSRILGEAMTPRQKRIYKDPVMASKWAIKHRQRFPEAEPYIATRPSRPRWAYWAYYYARDVIGGRWPEGEPAIATSPYSAYYYARDVIGGRWPEGEPAIATSPDYANQYLEAFPEAKLEWAMNGWLDWLDL
jgi:hypothetical protein